MTSGDPARAGLPALSAAFAAGALSPTAVLRAQADRIARLNPRLNAFLDMRHDAAMAEAAAADARWRRGAPLSSIDGAAFGAKANIGIAGLAFHGGIGAYRDRRAQRDAACVAVLRRAGAIPIGVLNMHEGALGATNDNPFFGKCRNPWDEALTPGGSSGGSAAAVAAGFCTFALGTDTMGSVRIPSAYCGVAGHKPTRDVISSEGVMPLSPTLDHVGVHAHAATDLQAIMAVLVEAAPAAAPNEAVIGVADWGGAVALDPTCARGWEDAVRMLARGWRTRTIDIAGFDFGGLRRKGLLISEIEGAAAHARMLAADRDGFSDAFRTMLAFGEAQPRGKRDAAYAAVREAGARFTALFDGIDVLVLPTAPQRPFNFEDAVPANQADFTALANFAGAPATAIPASRNGAPPPSIQFIGRPGADAMTLGVAAAFEALRGPAPKAP